ncbi:RPM1-interacting protein 4-like [Syzygium oleosum]|uniref:RPM1-interacting protein 4-like n=1 Tax=Syzygium oleosum TaxID=219896 RepID=UPI0011D26D08|nr:RPM1-interacting protein 4-like [Syzygium oleosum]
MAQRSRVPQFGKWNTDEDVAYTVYFEKAREQRGGVGVKVGNPNDPQENPELHPNGAPESKFAPPPGPKPRVATEESRGPEPARMAQDRRARADDSDLRRSINPSVRKDNAASRTNDSRQASGEPYKRPAGSNPGYDHSADRSPLHHQAKASGGAAYGSSPGGHGRARARADDSLSGGAAVPKFGEWNVNDPASGDGYTDVFNRIKEERQRGPGTAMSPGPNVRGSPYTGNRKPNPRDNPKSCCCPWF